MSLNGFLLVFLAALLVEPSESETSQTGTVQLILHGRESTKGKWPWHTALFHKVDHSFVYACGGTLISTTHVLTAAHCTISQKTGYPINRKNLFVDAGAHDLNQLQHRQRHSVRKISKFDNYTQQSHRYDIAILELDSEVERNQYVKPVLVFLGQDLTDKIGTAVGWGRTELDATASILREAQLPVVDFYTCRNSDPVAFGLTLERAMFCAGYTNGTGLCNGDSGGGLFFEINGEWHLGGIASFTKAREENSALCQTKGYTVFTKLHDYLTWIGQTAGLDHLLVSEKDDSGSDLCSAKSPNATNTSVTKLPRHCGVYYPNRMNLGQRTKVFEFPWMARLIYDDSEDPNECAGSLINNRYVLTTPACVVATHRLFIILTKVRLGEHTLDRAIDCNEADDCAPPVQDIDVECTVVHPDFSFGHSNNIALIRLAKYVEFKDHIQPICLPTGSSLREMDMPRYILTGWGSTGLDQEQSSVLRKATLSAVNVTECDAESELADYVLCAGGNNSAGICYGDAGGPLGYAVRYRGIRFIQFAIASRENWPCGVGASIFTKVAPYMEWILANIEP